MMGMKVMKSSGLSNPPDAKSNPSVRAISKIRVKIAIGSRKALRTSVNMTSMLATPPTTNKAITAGFTAVCVEIAWMLSMTATARR